MSKPILIPCSECGKERLVYPDIHKYKTGLCWECSLKRRKQPRAEDSPQWRGGRKLCAGYISVYLNPDDPFFPMTNGWDNYVLEHRLVMAQHLERCLTSDELVHHLNGIRDDNRIENLSMVNRKDHPNKTFMYLLQERLRELEKKLKGVE